MTIPTELTILKHNVALVSLEEEREPEVYVWMLFFGNEANEKSNVDIVGIDIGWWWTTLDREGLKSGDYGTRYLANDKSKLEYYKITADLFVIRGTMTLIERPPIADPKQIYWVRPAIKYSGLDMATEYALRALDDEVAAPHANDVDGHIQNLNNVDILVTNVGNLESQIDTLNHKTEELDDRMDKLPGELEERFKDAMERILTSISNLEDLTKSHEKLIDGIDFKISELREDLEDVEKKLGVEIKSTGDSVVALHEFVKGGLEDVNGKYEDVSKQISDISKTTVNVIPIMEFGKSNAEWAVGEYAGTQLNGRYENRLVDAVLLTYYMIRTRSSWTQSGDLRFREMPKHLVVFGHADRKIAGMKMVGWVPMGNDTLGIGMYQNDGSSVGNEIVTNVIFAGTMKGGVSLVRM